MSSVLQRIKPRKSWWPWLVAIVVVAGIAFSVSGSSQSAAALDPSSAKPSGTKALALLAQHYGANIRVAGEPSGTSAILLQDNLSNDERDKLMSWVHIGGRLIVADPDSPVLDLSKGGGGLLSQPDSLSPSCDDAVVQGVQRIMPARYGNYDVFKLAPLSTACFPGKQGSFLVDERYGNGHVIAVGGPDLFTNAQLGKSDNSVLAMNLLQPRSGGSITFLYTQEVGTSGNESMWDLLPHGVDALIWQLTIAAGVLMLWRARRVGKPISESQAVEVPASQLTVAVGNLLQNAGETSGAAAILRQDLRRSLAGMIGLAPDVDATMLSTVVSERTGINRDRLLYVTLDRPVEGSRDLVELAQTIEEVHREVANAR